MCQNEYFQWAFAKRSKKNGFNDLECFSQDKMIQKQLELIQDARDRVIETIANDRKIMRTQMAQLFSEE